MLSITNPFTESKEFELPLLKAGEVDSVVRRARAAFEGWAREPISARAQATL